MRQLKPTGVKINIDGKDRELKFTINAIDEIQEHYNMSIGELIEELFGESEEQKRKSYPMLRYITTVLINEDVDNHNDVSEDKWEHVDEKYVGRKLSTDNYGLIALMILKSFSVSLPESEEDDDPNQESGQLKK